MCKDMLYNLKLEKNLVNTNSLRLETLAVDTKKNLEVNDEIGSELNKVSLENIKQNLIKLSLYPTRHTKSQWINDAADWLKNKLESIGYENVFFHEYTERIDGSDYKLKNIICNKNGNFRKCIIICAHYDSRMECKSDHTSRAPGANDNASGVSSILEIARVLYEKNLEYDIQFVLFSGEEQNFLGSEQYAKLIRKNKVNLYRLINLDMIGYPNLNPGKVIIEMDNNPNYEKYNRVLCNDKESIECAKTMIINTYKYTSLIPVEGSIYDSDYEPFEKRGYVVMGAYDGSAQPVENKFYHSTNDTPDKIDWNYLTEVTKMVLALILSLNKEYY